MSAPLCSLTLHLPDEAATESLARQLAPLVSGRDTGLAGGCIHLQGDLGAGKTAFTRALLRECGITGRIKSPSYALLESYKVSNLYFYHLDFIDLVIRENGWTQDSGICCVTTRSF